ncbi:hypothetical protein [Halomicronema sp. CCY15110]|uniref:hypothetical protein n=1 Tax=Halomicronema sp. CCY15110 TaxID=2767773 RepID=UPI001950E51A|nr:hypothetical protein [Halomicronema sp. CCY15110]
MSSRADDILSASCQRLPNNAINLDDFEQAKLEGQLQCRHSLMLCEVAIAKFLLCA